MTNIRTILILPFLWAGFAQAQTISTDPVGFIPVVAKGNSDTYLSIPLHRGVSFQGALSSVSDNALTVSASSFTANQFNGTHYVLIASGAKEGMWYAITATSSHTLTVDLAGDTLGTAVTAGTQIQVIPFWTLNTLFPEGLGVKASATLLPQTSILIPDQSRAGIDLAPTSSFFYYSGTQFGGEGWRRFGAAPTEKYDNEILHPDSYLIVRHESEGDTTINIPGAVQMTSLATILTTLAPSRAQDNALAFNVAVPTSLTASQLFESGSFAASSTIDQPADQLLVFDNAVAARNKQPSAVYYYFSGSSNGGSGWRRVGDLATIHNTTLVFQPASGYILRKAASPQSSSVVWSVRPSYVPQ